MIAIYGVALLVALLVYLLLSRVSFALRVGLALAVFALLSVVLTIWIVKIGDGAPPGAVTVMPLSMSTQVEFPFDSLPQQFVSSTYIQGKVSQENSIKEGDAEYDTLKKALSQETQGWQYDVNTYAPKQKYSSATMSINCLDSLVVVNYENRDAHWVQISKNLSAGFCQNK